MPMDTMMEGGPGRMAAGPEPDAGLDTAPDAAPAGNEASIFLSQESLGGRKVKVGDTLTLTVSDVDPETGDVQAELSESGGTTPEAPGGYASDFDNAIPEE